MKKIMIICLFLLTNILAESKTGYVFIPTGENIYDFNIINTDELSLPEYNNKKGLININSIIEISKNNELFLDLNFIEEIEKFYYFLLKNNLCSKKNDSFTKFIINKNENKECNLNQISINKISEKFNKNTKVKILGYKTISYGTFIFIKKEN